MKIVKWTYSFINSKLSILVPGNGLAAMSPQKQLALRLCSTNLEFFEELAVFRTGLGKVQGEPGTCCHIQKQQAFKQ